MKIAIAGDWRWPIYERAFADALVKLGHEVIPYKLEVFFRGHLGRIQNILSVPGPALISANHSVKAWLRRDRPDLFLAWRCTILMPSTIRLANTLGIRTVSYNNDDPFGSSIPGHSPWHHRFLWYWYLRALPYYQFNFFYRSVNVHEALASGAVRASVLRPYFIPAKDRPVQLNWEDRQRFESDVVFVGHYEADGRVECLKALINAGLKVRLFGGHYWTPSVLGEIYPLLAPITPVEGEEYARALCGARVCLAFLSKLNRDTYTRRCFEIPACGRAMLAERTSDLMEMFKEDQEACFFSSPEELVVKARRLLEAPQYATQIGRAGLRRVWVDRHHVEGRAEEFLAMCEG